METQASGQARVSQLSQMNAFYGIPLLSQETAQAVMQGKASRPEVYTPGENIAQAQADDNNPARQNVNGPEQNQGQNQNRLNDQPKDQVNLSLQAQALQEQTLNDQAPQPNSAGVEATGSGEAAARNRETTYPETPQPESTQPENTAGRARENTPRQTTGVAGAGTAGTTAELNQKQNSSPNDTATGNNNEATNRQPPVYQQNPGAQAPTSRGLKQPGTLFSAMG
jgi:hypothetical protein